MATTLLDSLRWWQSRRVTQSAGAPDALLDEAIAGAQTLAAQMRTTERQAKPYAQA
ncbi:hypothetical protein ACFFJ4_16720 [Xanthomonas dyei]|jgi:hypothetical protein|uniref:hypothetical protein n=1 Tax=Xanthomonas dyei TaxID=743699 RepID=UPI0013049349|nr:hypothetical protein [Xanthomonas dyei]